MTGMLSCLRRMIRLSAIVPLAAIVLNASAASAQSPLGSAQSFAVLGASIVTNTGATLVTGDLGVSPATAITGFPPGVLVGTLHAGDTVAAQAQFDASSANTGLIAIPCNTPLTGQDLGAVGPLGPGVYCFDTSAQLTGTLYLTGAGPWIFQIGSTLTTASNAAVVVVDAGTTCRGANVFWQVGTSATLGVGTAFAGTILTGASATVMTGASVSGSVLALVGAVTLDSNAVTVCDAPPANQPPVADAGPDQLVSFASLVTLDGSASSDDGQIHALTYSWVSDTEFSAAGPAPTLSLPVGTHVFTLTVNDGALSASDSVTIIVRDMTAPAITIASPGADAAYAVGQIVAASYACTDASGIQSCSGTAASGTPIDTSALGRISFCVTAVDGAGNTATQCVSYSVLEPPTITVTSPIDPIYERGSLLLAAYSCGHAMTCTGDVASGSALETSTPGLRTFTITATDAAGNTTTQQVTYTVSLGTCVMPFAGLTAWLPGDGTAIDRVADTPGVWTGVGTYAAGKVGRGFSVGNGNNVSLPFEQAGPFTVQAWLRTPDRLQPEFTGVLSAGGSAQSATSFQIELDGTGNYRLNVGDSTLSSLIGPVLDIFQHVAVTFDGTALTTYLNGQLVQRDVWAGSPGLGFHVLNVGIDRQGLHPFTGLVDEVQVFNRALSNDEVAQSFRTGASGLCHSQSPLGSAQSFAVLGASIVTNTGPTVITGDLGVSPGIAITGFPPGVLIGTMHAGDSVAAQAQIDAGIANAGLSAMACITRLTGQDLGAVGPLAPGVYCFDTSAQLTGTLRLTSAGPWIFQIGSTLTTASHAAVVMVDAGSTCSRANVFWQVGTSATLGVDTTFVGTILAGASVTVMTGASVSGSVLALTGAVTLDTNSVSVCDVVLSGTVISATTNAGLANVIVELYDASGQHVTSVNTGASGAYSASGLPTGTYYARTSNSLGYLDELYDDIACLTCAVTTGTPIAVTAGSTTSHVNFALSLPAAPTITSIAPSAVMRGGAAFTLTVNGTGFVATSLVRVGGSDRATTVVSATQSAATILASDIATTGILAITVFTPAPGGGTSNSVSLAVSGLTLSVDGALPPTELMVNGGATVAVQLGGDLGSDFTCEWVGVYLEGARDNGYSDFRYLNGTKLCAPDPPPTTVVNFTMPTAGGRYEFRYWAGGIKRATSTKVVSTALTLTVDGTAPSSEVTVPGGAILTVQLVGNLGSDPLCEWIAVYLEGAADNGYVNWFYLNGTKACTPDQAPGTQVSFAMPTTAGRYEFRYWAGGIKRATSTKVVVTVTLTVNGVASPTEVPVFGGAAVGVQLVGNLGSDFLCEWVALYREGAADNGYVDWFYLNGTKACIPDQPPGRLLNFLMPTVPGRYEFRYWAGGTKRATSTKVVVTSLLELSVNGVLPPSEVIVPAGATVSVQLSGNFGSDPLCEWIGVYPDGAADNGYVNWAYLNGTKTCSPDQIPNTAVNFAMPATGRYQLRYWAGGLKRATSTTVVVLTTLQ